MKRHKYRIASLQVALAAFVLFATNSALAKLNVVTTLTDLRAVASEVAGDLANVDAIAKGTQDPHYIEPKPSYMVKARNADLMISIGLDLEIGWLPSIISGSRNSNIVRGQKGFLEVGPLLDPIDVPTGTISRAEGDVHPFGNPHVNMDPIRMGKAAIVIAERMGELDAAHAAQYMQNAKALQARMEKKTAEWQARIDKTGIKKIVTYHKTLDYFFERFHLVAPAILEPKPGIPPTQSHTMDVIEIIKEQHVPLILVENFFDPTVTDKIKVEVPSVREVTVPVDVDGAPGINTIDDLYENTVKAIEGK